VSARATVALAVTGIVSATLAYADGPFADPGITFIWPPAASRRAPTEDPDLNRAMAWCDSHVHETYNGSMGGDPRYGYDDARCGAVEIRWANSRSQTAAREAEAAAKRAADQAWFDQYFKSAISDAK
jgi:hypothetical protein